MNRGSINMSKKWKIKGVLLLVIGLSLSNGFADTVKEDDNSNTAKTWKVEKHGVHFSLTQLFPDQLRAFYISRGFTSKQTEPFATSCVFMTVLRNDNAAGNATGKIHFARKNWSVSFADKLVPLKELSRWIEELNKNKVKKSAQVAFRWAQFPVEQTYEPGGDWNQGMLSVGLEAESEFNIIARWDMAGKTYESELKGVRCAK